FFIPYEDIVAKSKTIILDNIIQENSDVIAQAQEEPTNDEKQENAYRHVYKATYKYLSTINTKLNKNILTTLIINEILGFGPLDPLWRDRKIDEIMCNGPYDIQVEISGKIHKVPSINFRDKNHM